MSYAAGLAQSVERLTAEREVAGSIPGAKPLLTWVLQLLRNDGTPFALQAAGPSGGKTTTFIFFSWTSIVFNNQLQK